MEIVAKVYVIANGEEFLKKLYSIMQECVPVIKDEAYYISRNTEIDGWIELEEKEYDVWERDDWDAMLEKCGEEVNENGAVIVVFSSPDSDTYEETASSTASGSVICCNTEMDWENLDSRLDEFKDQFEKSYKHGKELYKWFEKKVDFVSDI